MQDLKMKIETVEVIYPQEYANSYKNYLEECKEYDENSLGLTEWLENELAEDYCFDLWNSEITNFDEIIKEIEKFL